MLEYSNIQVVFRAYYLYHISSIVLVFSPERHLQTKLFGTRSHFLFRSERTPFSVQYIIKLRMLTNICRFL